MLPDLPVVKAELQQFYIAEYRASVNKYLGFFALANRNIVVEGEGSAILRPDGTSDDTTFRVAKSEVTVPFADVPTLNHEKVFGILDKMAEAMAGQISKGAIESIGKAAEDVGNVVKGGGAPLSPDRILEMWGKMHIDFNAKGEPSMPTIVANPAMVESIGKALEAMDSDPVLRAKRVEIFQRKYEEWRAREADRKLVG